MTTIADTLNNLRRTHPRYDRGLGFIHRTRAELGHKFRKATHYTVLESDEGTLSVHETLFRKKKGKTPAQWSAWIEEESPAIYRGFILPGIEKRTSKLWRLHTLVGFIAHDMVKPRRPKVARTRTKAKRSRRKNGPTHIRRRH